jgi:hypothetical protein
MFKRSFASLGENIKYLGVIALIFFPLVLLSYLSDIFGVYWGMDDAIKGVKEVLGSQDLTALNTYTASAYQSLSFNQGFDTAYANFSSMTWAKGFYEGLKNLLTTSYPSASQAAENAINQARGQNLLVPALRDREFLWDVRFGLLHSVSGGLAQKSQTEILDVLLNFCL